MITFATLVRNKAGDAIVDMIDVGSVNASGRIEFRTTTKPANPQTAAPGVILATLWFSNPAYRPFSNGRAAVNPITPDTNIAETGVCGWFRVYDRNNTPVWDGEVTITGDDGDIEFDNINFVQGGTVNLIQLDATYPE